jgi:Putative transposase/Transposase zinc-binding domain
MCVTLQQILQQHFDDFARRHPLSLDMRRAAGRMRVCRTAALGGHVISCPRGHVDRIAYNSCRHRSCPQCSRLPRERWLAGWQNKLLNCPHFHTVFTTPHQLLPLWRYNKREFATALFQSASESLLQLLSEEEFLGGQVGLLAALHTWSQTLAGHVHLHVLVTAGGLSEGGRWQSAKKSCLLPRRVLMMVFRGKLRAALLRALQRGVLRIPPDTSAAQLRSLLNRLGRIDWNVKILERYDHGNGVAKYLARYLRGGPISNQRLIELREGRVKFRVRQRSAGNGQRPDRALAHLSVDDFLQRLLEHVPPRGFQTVRGYGLYAGSQPERLKLARVALGPGTLRGQSCSELPTQDESNRFGGESIFGSAGRCPKCGAGLISHSPFSGSRGPPCRAPGLRVSESPYAAPTG